MMIWSFTAVTLEPNSRSKELSQVRFPVVCGLEPNLSVNEIFNDFTRRPTRLSIIPIDLTNSM